MRRDGTHQHYCCNRSAGCKSTYECSNGYLERNYDPDGAICGINPLDDQPCEDCLTSQCSECGRTKNIEQCEEDCSKRSFI